MLTDAQLASSVALIQYLAETYSTPIDQDHVVGHYRLDSVDRANCPGPSFPWDQLFAALQPPDPLTVIKERLKAKGIVTQDHFGPVDWNDLYWVLGKLEGLVS